MPHQESLPLGLAISVLEQAWGRLPVLDLVAGPGQLCNVVFQLTHLPPPLLAPLGVGVTAEGPCRLTTQLPVGEDRSGNTVYAYSPLAPEQVQPVSTAPVPAPVSGQAMPQALNIKLYPINDLANQTGVLSGQVTNLMTGKGRFVFNYQGETLVGEATRVANDERRGIANAYGPGGVFAQCEYQMSSPRMGAGTCTFSNNAMYQVHIGN